MNKKQYSLDSEGFWYLWDEVQGVFQLLHETTLSNEIDENVKISTSTLNTENIILLNKKTIIKKREVPGISFHEENGFPIFPKNNKGCFILPKDENEQPFFPLDENNTPIFPYDFEKHKWTFPVDDTDEPIFPRNELNKPLIPVDEIGKKKFISFIYLNIFFFCKKN